MYHWFGLERRLRVRIGSGRLAAHRKTQTAFSQFSCAMPSHLISRLSVCAEAGESFAEVLG